MERVAELARAAARTSSPVLLHGASGTGKDLIARAIHELSPRRTKPFLAVNCGGLPAELVESELFGCTKGAYTGAEEARQGIFRAADGGTVFLDEIGEMPIDTQVKLLRVLQEGAVRPVGDVRERPVDVRLLAATNRSPRESMASGRLREDLYYRLSVILIEVPKLEKRTEDLEELCEFFLENLRQRYGRGPRRITRAAWAALKKHPWPGNVRELENVLDRVFVLDQAREAIDLEHLPPQLRQPDLPESRNSCLAVCGGIRGTRTLDECEACVIRATLVRSRGNKSEAARILGISRPNLYYRIKKHGLED